MANFNLPRRGGAAANALQSLYNTGGKATISDWMRTVRWKQSRMQFCRSVIDSLERAWLIKVFGEQCEALPAARQYLGIPATNPTPVPAELVAPRTAMPFRPMQRSRSPMVIRAGAFDYRDHPSRIGDEFVAYKGAGAAGTTSETFKGAGLAGTTSETFSNSTMECNMNIQSIESLMRLSSVKAQTGLSKSEIYRRIKLRQFPAPVQLGVRAVAWKAAEIDVWIKSLIKQGAPLNNGAIQPGAGSKDY